MQLSIVDDYQADSIFSPLLKTDSDNKITFVLTDEYLADSLDPDILFVKYDPSQYQNMIFTINIEDDFAKANDEYVLITEDGLVISMEDWFNQDQIAITVR